MRTRIAIWLSMALVAIVLSAPTTAARQEPKTATEFLGRGETAFKKGEYDRAIKDYTEVLNLDPKSAPAYTGRGLAYTKNDNPLKAIGDFNEAIQLDPKGARAYSGRGLARLNLGWTEKAIADFNEAIALDPKLAAAFHGRGLARQDEGDTEKAIEDLTRALRLEPGSAETLTDRGNAYLVTKDLELATDDCTAAIRLNPKLAPAFYTRALAWLERGAIDKALADATEAIKLAPKAPKYYMTRSACLLRQGTDFAAALRDANEAIRLDPKDPWALGQRADVYGIQGEWADVRKDLDAAIKLGPNAADLYTSRGLFLACCPEAKYRDEIQAFKDAERACELTDWKNPYALGALAAASAALGDFAGATKWQTKALEDRDYARTAQYAPARLAAYAAKKVVRFAPPIRDRTDARQFVSRGKYYYQTREYEYAVRDFDEAIKLDPKSAKAFAGRGCAWTQLDQDSKALADFTQAIELDPNDPSAFVDRSVVRLNRGEWKLALADCDTAIQLDPKHVSAYARRALIRSSCADPKYRDATLALKDGRMACELTGWKAGPALEAYAAACAEAGDFESAVKWQATANTDEEYMERFGRSARYQLLLYQVQKPLRMDEPKRKLD